MKVQCPSCREIVEMADFSTSDAGLSLHCPSCGASDFLANPHAGERQENLQPRKDLVVCPKCGHGQTDPVACHRCGLMLEKFDPQSLPPDPEEPAALWRQIQSNPADESLHESFLKSCLGANRPDYAARQYRLLSRRAGCNPLAEKMLARLFVLGQARLAPAALLAPHREDPRRTGKILFWIVVAVSLALFGYLMLSVSDTLTKMAP